MNEMELKFEELLSRLDKLEKENSKLKNGAKASGSRNASERIPVEVGCNLITGAQLSSPSGDVDIYIKYGETVVVSSDDVAQILKSSTNREFFINGLLFLVDESGYERLNIKRKFNINSDVIKELILSNNIDSIKKFFDLTTRNKIDSTMTHTVFYTIVILNINNELGGMLYETRQFVEKYFSMELQMAGKLYVALKGVEG